MAAGEALCTFRRIKGLRDEALDECGGYAAVEAKPARPRKEGYVRVIE